MAKKHLTYYDFWRGLSILMVVAGHTGQGYDFSTFWGNFYIILRFIISGSVPVFIALSGFFLCKKDLSNNDLRLSFWKRQIPKVYFPMLFWSIPYFIIHLNAGGGIARGIFYFFSGGFSIYYFIALIIQCYFFLPLIQRDVKHSLIVSVILAFISWGSINYLLPRLPVIFYAGPVLGWIFYFILGVAFAKRESVYSIMVPILLMLIGITLQYVEGANLLAQGGNGMGQKMSTIFSNTALVLFVFHPQIKSMYRSDSLFSKCIEYLGRNSFGIYLVHYFFILLLNDFLPENYWTLRCLLVLVVTLVFIKIVKIIIPENICIKYLGFR